jgi:hypothetical protein
MSGQPEEVGAHAARAVPFLQRSDVRDTSVKPKANGKMLAMPYFMGSVESTPEAMLASEAQIHGRKPYGRYAEQQQDDSPERPESDQHEEKRLDEKRHLGVHDTIETRPNICRPPSWTTQCDPRK